MGDQRENRLRVVVTGMGAITPLGSRLETYWEGLQNGRSGIRRITQFDPSDMPCQIAGEIPDFNPEEYMDRKEARRTPAPARSPLPLQPRRCAMQVFRRLHPSQSGLASIWVR